MALKLVLNKLEDVEEPLRELYKAGGDGKFYLDAEENEDSKKKMAEFRENNIKLMKEKSDLEEKLKGMGDPKQIEEMKKKLQLIEDKKLLEAGKLDELVAQKTERMRQDYESQIDALRKAVDAKQTELDKTTESLSSVLIDSEITRAVTGVGIPRKGALQDLLARGKKVFRLEDGKPIPKEGDKVLYGKDGKAPMTFDEWASIQAESAAYLFEPSSGSGSAGGTNKQVQKTGDLDLSKIAPQERLKMIHSGEIKA